MDSSTDAANSNGGVATEQQTGPVRCTGGCGFFGSEQFGGYCSQCYKTKCPQAPATHTPASTEISAKPVSHKPNTPSPQPATTESSTPTPAPAASCAEPSCDDQKMEPEPESAAAPEPQPKKKSKKKKKVRCSVCRKKLRAAMQIPCKCGQMHCSRHRLPMEHSCTFDYKSAQQCKIRKYNDKISFAKLDRIE